MPLFHVTVRKHTHTGRYYHDVVEAESFEDAVQLAAGRASAPQPRPGACIAEPAGPRPAWIEQGRQRLASLGHLAPGVP